MHKRIKNFVVSSNNTFDCSLDLLGPVMPGQVLQLYLCVPHSSDSDEIFILVVETLNAILPTSACRVKHQNQFIKTIRTSSKSI